MTEKDEKPTAAERAEARGKQIEEEQLAAARRRSEEEAASEGEEVELEEEAE